MFMNFLAIIAFITGILFTGLIGGPAVYKLTEGKYKEGIPGTIITIIIAAITVMVGLTI